jgi:hypothetical protein
MYYGAHIIMARSRLKFKNKFLFFLCTFFVQEETKMRKFVTTRKQIILD